MWIARRWSVHIGQPLTTHDLWQSWPSASADTLALVTGIVATGVCYARGVGSLWSRAGRARGVSRWRAGCFGAGLLTLLIAGASPLDVLSGELFAAHMVQHLLIIMIASPLLLLGEPAFVLLWAWPLRMRRVVGQWWSHTWLRRAAGALGKPLISVPLHTAVVWLWHAPRLYDAALRSPALHALEHATFLATALLFWHSIIDRRALRHQGAPIAILSLFVIALQCVVLGALLAMGRRPWYVAHQVSSLRWGFSPLADQQLAGIIMWVPAGVVYLGAMAVIAVRLLARRDPPMSALPRGRPRAYAMK